MRYRLIISIFIIGILSNCSIMNKIDGKYIYKDDIGTYAIIFKYDKDLDKYKITTIPTVVFTLFDDDIITTYENKADEYNVQIVKYSNLLSDKKVNLNIKMKNNSLVTLFDSEKVIFDKIKSANKVFDDGVFKSDKQTFSLRYNNELDMYNIIINGSNSFFHLEHGNELHVTSAGLNKKYVLHDDKIEIYDLNKDIIIDTLFRK